MAAAAQLMTEVDQNGDRQLTVEELWGNVNIRSLISNKEVLRSLVTKYGTSLAENCDWSLMSFERAAAGGQDCPAVVWDLCLMTVTPTGRSTIAEPTRTGSTCPAVVVACAWLL
jgi:hypothetical protein